MRYNIMTIFIHIKRFFLRKFVIDCESLFGMPRQGCTNKYPQTMLWAIDYRSLETLGTLLGWWRHMRPKKTQISLQKCKVWSVSSLLVWAIYSKRNKQRLCPHWLVLHLYRLNQEFWHLHTMWKHWWHRSACPSAQAYQHICCSLWRQVCIDKG